MDHDPEGFLPHTHAHCSLIESRAQYSQSVTALGLRSSLTTAHGPPAVPLHSASQRLQHVRKHKPFPLTVSFPAILIDNFYIEKKITNPTLYCQSTIDICAESVFLKE